MVNKPAAFHRGCWLPTAAVRSMQSYEKYSERQCRPWLFRGGPCRAACPDGGPCCAVCRVILSEIRLPVGCQIVMLSVLNSFYLFLPAVLSGRTAVAAMPNGPYCDAVRPVSASCKGGFGWRPLCKRCRFGWFSVSFSACLPPVFAFGRCQVSFLQAVAISRPRIAHLPPCGMTAAPARFSRGLL